MFKPDTPQSPCLCVQSISCSNARNFACFCWRRHCRWHLSHHDPLLTLCHSSDLCHAALCHPDVTSSSSGWLGASSDPVMGSIALLGHGMLLLRDYPSVLKVRSQFQASICGPRPNHLMWKGYRDMLQGISCLTAFCFCYKNPGAIVLFNYMFIYNLLLRVLGHEDLLFSPFCFSYFCLHSTFLHPIFFYFKIDMNSFKVKWSLPAGWWAPGTKHAVVPGC